MLGHPIDHIGFQLYKRSRCHRTMWVHFYTCFVIQNVIFLDIRYDLGMGLITE